MQTDLNSNWAHMSDDKPSMARCVYGCYIIMLTSPCNEHPGKPYFILEKVGFTGGMDYFSIFDLNLRL